VIDHSDPSIVDLSPQVGGGFEIERWATDDRGWHWRHTTLVPAGSTENVRPVVPRGWDDGPMSLLWLRGNYGSYSLYRTSIVYSPEVRSCRVCVLPSDTAFSLWLHDLLKPQRFERVSHPEDQLTPVAPTAANVLVEDLRVEQAQRRTSAGVIEHSGEHPPAERDPPARIASADPGQRPARGRQMKQASRGDNTGRDIDRRSRGGAVIPQRDPSGRNVRGDEPGHSERHPEQATILKVDGRLGKAVKRPGLSAGPGAVV
jgi:hypothetical protein